MIKPTSLTPHWLSWRKSPPREPGYYWAWSPDVWPKIIKFEYSKGKLQVVDGHSAYEEGFWQYVAGPIPAPIRLPKQRTL